MAPVLLPIPDVCDALSVSRRTVYRLIASGELESTRCRGRRLVPRAALNDYVRTLRQQSRGGPHVASS